MALFYAIVVVWLGVLTHMIIIGLVTIGFVVLSFALLNLCLAILTDCNPKE